MGAVTVTDLQARQIREQRLKGCGYKAIASAVGLSRDLVRNYCRSNGLDGNAEVLAADDPAHRDVQCPNCDKPLTQPRTGRKRKFCSDACRRAWWSAHPATLQRSEGALYQMTCACCGKPFLSYGNRNRRFCGRNCYIQERFKRSELSCRPSENIRNESASKPESTRYVGSTSREAIKKHPLTGAERPHHALRNE